MPSPVRLTTSLQRKDPGLPVYVVVPADDIQDWRLTATTVIEGRANGLAFGRRTIKAWGHGSADWFIEFTADFCRRSGLQPGDSVALEIELADPSTPDELLVLLQADHELARAWTAWTARARRDAGEQIRAAKRPETRVRRARRIADQLRSDWNA